MPDTRRSWAGVLGASGKGSVVLSMSTLYLADPPEFGTPGRLALVKLSAESAQVWADWKQRKSWSI